MTAQTPAIGIHPGSLGLIKATPQIKVPPAAHGPAQVLIYAEMQQWTGSQHRPSSAA